MLAPVVFALAGKGRYWCGNFCPMGSISAYIAFLKRPKKDVPSQKEAA